MYDPYAEFTKNTLSNGLEVHSTYWERPWIIVEIVIHSGGREDPKNIPGLAHFVEHVISQNIPGKSYSESKNFFDNCGGSSMFGSTNYLATKYRFKVPTNPDIFTNALEIFGSMLLNAQIEKDVERERDVILREFNESYPFVKRMEWEMDVNSSLFTGHRLETWNGAIGRPEGFLAATRSDLQEFYDKYYVPSNISLVVVGGITTSELVNLLENSPFGKHKKGRRNPITEPLQELPILKKGCSE